MSNPRTYSVGEFARLGGVTIKALHYYDQAGLLRPASVVARTGYRRYDAGQLPDLYDILGLARAGVSLSRIRAVVQAEMPADARRVLLMAAKQEIETRLANERTRLASVEAQLAELDGAARRETAPLPATAYTVLLKRQAPVRVATARDLLPSFAVADAMLDELEDGSARLGARLRGAVWHDCGAVTNVIDCEAIIALPWRAIDPAARRSPVRVRELPAETMACVVHCGGEDTIEGAYVAARRWIAAQGYAIAGPNREWYVGENAGGTVTEIQFPVTGARA